MDPVAQGPEQKVRTFHDALVQRWQGLHKKIAPQASFESFWQKSLQDGGVVEPVERQPAPALQSQPPVTVTAPQATEGMHLWLWPSILLFDGRLANRGWMQEIPERMSTIAWGSWVDISPATARRMKIATGDVIEVSNGFGSPPGSCPYNR